ncbi:hypothetical protein [Psychromicrobium lacuslunae]|uniref:SipW-cognate class signal peptide n=1 Tax=Psychromicrobium lacuslunae TaxID=1618207 RepID=A0A0D4BWE0_9MICC|nr:hypothetical protein [Psychromicrobium lacuslunae]AJT40445.1 hypothetical protein UM93_00750 [Psychromicrobium lacuslunae]
MRRRFIFASLAVVLAFILLGGAGTAALWRSNATINAGTVGTGTLIILNGDASTQVKNTVLSSLTASALVPGGSAQAPLTVRNAGTAKFAYGLAGITGNAVGTASVALQSALQISIIAVANTAACPVNGAAASGTQLYNGAVSSSATFSAVQNLLPSTSMVLCLRITLPSSATVTVAAGQLALTFNWRADQIR